MAHCSDALLAVPVRTAVQLSVPPGFMTFSPLMLPGFRHLPRFIWHRPGASLNGVFSEAYVARPIPEAAVGAHLAPCADPTSTARCVRSPGA
jgi:hypothetical protein